MSNIERELVEALEACVEALTRINLASDIACQGLSAHALVHARAAIDKAKAQGDD